MVDVDDDMHSVLKESGDVHRAFAHIAFSFSDISIHFPC